MRYLPIAIALVLGLAALDFYVYRNWERFVRYRKKGRWTLPVYRVLLAVMPLTLPLYLSMFRWWEVEPKLLRAAFVGFWAFYYIPKIPIALVIALKDATHLIDRQFRWLQRRRAGERDEEYPQSPDLTELRHMSRSEFLRRMGWTAASIPFVAVGFGVLRSLYDFQVEHVVLRSASVPRQLHGLRVAQISDLHAGSLFSSQPLREVVELLNANPADIVVFTGDFVNNNSAELRDALPLLQRVTANIGAFACLGNHEHYARVNEVVAAMGETPFELLVNAHRTITIDGARLYVIGTDNTGFNQRYADLPRATEGIPSERRDDFRLLLAHDPSFWDEARHLRPDIDLTLSGHTHGGQVGFALGPLRWSLARLVYERWAGLYREMRPGNLESAHFLYVNRGLGTVGPPVRIGMRPEITIIELSHA